MVEKKVRKRKSLPLHRDYLLTKMSFIQLILVVVFLLPGSEQQQSPGEPVSLCRRTYPRDEKHFSWRWGEARLQVG